MLMANADLTGVIWGGVASDETVFEVGVVGLEGKERRSHMFNRCGRDADTVLGAESGAAALGLSGL